MQAAQTSQSHSERLFLNSVSSTYSRESYRIYLHKYLQIVGYHDLTQLLSRDHKQIENEIIEFIISFKEKGMKRAAITNYIKPVISFCKINDIMLNTKKINRFMPPNIRNKKTKAYLHEQIQKLLEIGDERMRAVILLLCSTGCRRGALPGLNVGNLEEVNDLYKITIYENEPEEYTVFCTSEARKAIIDYLKMRERYGEVITTSSPLVREQFGLLRHFRTGTQNEETATSEHEIDENHKANEQIPAEITLEKDTKEPSDPNNPPHLSHPSQFGES